MVKVGQRYRVMPYFTGRDAREEKIQIGIVIYVHPKGRYVVLEFEGINGKPREGYHMDELTKGNFAGYGKGGKA